MMKHLKHADLALISILIVSNILTSTKFISTTTIRSVCYILIAAYITSQLELRKIRSIKIDFPIVAITAFVSLYFLFSYITLPTIEYKGILFSIKIIIITMLIILMKTKYSDDTLYNFIFSPFLIVGIVSLVIGKLIGISYSVGNIKSIYTNKNDYGMILMIGTIFIATKIENEFTFKNLLKLLLFVFAFSMVALVGSRQALISTILGLVTYTLSRRNYRVLIVGIALFTILVLSINEIRTRLLSSGKDPSSISRIKIISACAKLIKHKPLGYGSSEKVYWKIKQIELDESLKHDFKHGGCHFSILDAGIHFGILGIAAFLAIWSWSIYKLVESVRKKIPLKNELIMLLALLVSSLFENYTEYDRLLRIIITLALLSKQGSDIFKNSIKARPCDEGL